MIYIGLVFLPDLKVFFLKLFDVFLELCNFQFVFFDEFRVFCKDGLNLLAIHSLEVLFLLG